jgi:hypothetical protein
MVGGGGEKRTLKAAARFADITNWFGTLEEAAAKLAVLDRHCEAIGRDPAEITRTVAVPIVPVAREADKARVLDAIAVERRSQFKPVLVDEGAEFLRGYLDAGFDGFTFRDVAIRTPEAVALVGELIAKVRPQGVPPDAASILGHPGGRHGATFHRRLLGYPRRRQLPLHRLRSDLVRVDPEVRQPLRLAELLRRARQVDGHHARGRQIRHEADRGPMRQLRRASGPYLRRRAEADRAALLHQLRVPGIREENGGVAGRATAE